MSGQLRPLVTHTREMGITHREYQRTLKRAIEGRTYTFEDGGGNQPSVARIEDGNNRIEIHLAPQRLRRIATIKLPVTDVEFRFFGHTQAQADAVMARLELYFRRGGG